jgi:putative glutamine amidotransferase
VGRELVDGRRHDAIPVEYVAGVVRAGGVPILLPPVPDEAARAALDGLDGLLLTGGGDVDPACYGAGRQPETELVDRERDETEAVQIAGARARGLPILGICRGAQMLNVAAGGRLHQHLDDRPIRHKDPGRRDQEVHQVAVEPGSRLAGLAGTTTVAVNSIHHQGIAELGAGLRVVGRAPDGVIEALESEDGAVLAVQWHPECLADSPVSRALFGWLVAEARR